MSHETIALSQDARGVVTLRLARADKRNALSATMIAELTEAATGLDGDASVRAVVLAADGPVFCAGGDLAWMHEQIRSDRAGRMREATRLAAMLKTVNEMRKPLIGRVHGDAYGGGVGMMSVCDTVVAAEGARFALTETRLGLIPATIGPYVAARMGEARARRVFMSSRVFDAAEAIDLGLVSKSVPADALDAAVEAEIAPYLTVAPGAVGAAKSLLRALGPVIDEAVIAMTIERLADQWESEEAAHGIASFLEKKKARWTAPGAP